MTVTVVEAKDLSLYRAVGEGGQLSGLDAKLLEYAAARMSPEQISDELNGVVTPARAAQRVREILRSQDWLSQTEQLGLLMVDMIRLRDLLFERVEGTDTKITKHGDTVEIESDSRHAANLIRLFAEIRKTTEVMQKTISDGKIQINQAYAEMFLSALETMFERFLLRLKESGVELPKREETMLIMEEVMPIGFQSLQKNVAP